MQFNFEWDPAKAKENLRKHRISFEKAAEIFLDRLALSIFDDKHSLDEDRWITIGQGRKETFIVVMHTFSELDADHCNIRIISARKATRKEADQYRGNRL